MQESLERKVRVTGTNLILRFSQKIIKFSLYIKMNKRQYNYIMYRVKWIKGIAKCLEKSLKEELMGAIEDIEYYLKLEVMRRQLNLKR